MPAPRVLVVEDEALIALQLASALRQRGFDVSRPVGVGEDAVAEARMGDYGAIIMDITLRGSMNGIEAAREIGTFSGAKIIFATGHTDEETMRRVSELHPAALLGKPVDIDELERAIRKSLA